MGEIERGLRLSWNCRWRPLLVFELRDVDGFAVYQVVEIHGFDKLGEMVQLMEGNRDCGALIVRFSGEKRTEREVLLLYQVKEEMKKGADNIDSDKEWKKPIQGENGRSSDAEIEFARRKQIAGSSWLDDGDQDVYEFERGIRVKEKNKKLLPLIETVVAARNAIEMKAGIEDGSSTVYANGVVQA
ncbi:hypothetical protein C5167_049779 [Papaver somniferum]|uniref:Uncharacterized protein n=1 Tax=Papaver somniferum TaxID=3469 RepID=A0A4Y7KN63_PAPSO|nr:hypothetical protein C5167_049779 [Papaver somniferum]